MSESRVSEAPVRLAAPADVPELVRLRWALRTELDGASEGQGFEAFAGRAGPFFREAIRSGRWTILVAEADGRLAGCACLQLVAIVPRAGQPEARAWGYLTDVFVEPELRDRGLGTRILDAALAWARAEGLETVIVWPSERSLSLYRRLGFAQPAELLELPRAVLDLVTPRKESEPLREEATLRAKALLVRPRGKLARISVGNAWRATNSARRGRGRVRAQ